MNVATIMAKDLILRPLELSDATLICSKIYTFENTKYMLFKKPETVEKTLSNIEKAIKEYKKKNPKFIEFAVTMNNVIMGLITLYRDKKDSYEICWIIDPLYANRGLMHKACNSVIDYAKKSDVKRITAHADIKNVSSITLMEKLGMKRNPIISERKYASGEKSFEVMYELEF